ncbi:MAG: Dinucleotide-utilizing enzyme [Candidatus Falkowbacteria bacterium GW2011_GWA2_39_24]|uniref:Dinucleotide-utilizing enzyme n=1 Tax=Candidatus Falkowbacteria bacterium GW2011_GWA2_39_24 TaxID=1618634 RepID=A0A0G0NPV3_9BACT|nr:MAG: Dinucleotide-utilizing enzyme [Candidatus Falkowbacteria bacterium GW2011_GWA2_39_24]
MHPEILDSLTDKERIEKLKQNNNVKVIDCFNDQIKELNKIKKVIPNKLIDVWIYYPWNKVLVRILNKEDYRLLRLSRNKNLITNEEQKKFSHQKIGIAGLNVGNPGALCIVLEGGAETMKFADNDILELSNLNRFRASLENLGINKAILSAHQAYEIDPFINIEIFDRGVSEDNIDQFLTQPRIDLLIEEMDNLPLKIRIRERAKYYKIPVLMVTGNGPGLIIDVERFDLEPNLPLLNGYLKENVIKRISTTLTETMSIQEKSMLARDFIGTEFLNEKLKQSFDLVGKELASIPQTSESSFLRGVALCYFARQIATNYPVPSGRYHFSLDSLIND